MLPSHRHIWQFIERQLDTVDFRGKSWSSTSVAGTGYWSFHAERSYAPQAAAGNRRSNLQNWSDDCRGVHLAKELYGSSVRINQDVSVYRLQELNQKFDIILLLGVYYHLFDPFYAFSQLRHCCHRNTLVLVEGIEELAFSPVFPGTAQFAYSRLTCEWLPSWEALCQVLQGTYFTVDSAASTP